MLTLGFQKSTLTNKSKEHHLRHWTINDFFYLKEVIKLHIDFRLFRNLHLTNKSGKDHFKVLDLKNDFLGDDKILIYELILALVSL